MKGEDKIFKNLLSTYKHYLPYVVLIFTHGKHLGGTEDEQKSIVAGMIKEVNEKQKNSNLNQLLKNKPSLHNIGICQANGERLSC